MGFIDYFPKWSPPSGYVSGDVPTHIEFNKYIRDNMAALGRMSSGLGHVSLSMDEFYKLPRSFGWYLVPFTGYGGPVMCSIFGTTVWRSPTNTQPSVTIRCQPTGFKNGFPSLTLLAMRGSNSGDRKPSTGQYLSVRRMLPGIPTLSAENSGSGSGYIIALSLIESHVTLSGTQHGSITLHEVPFSGSLSP